MNEFDRDRRITVLNIVPDERLGGPQRRVFEVARRLQERNIETIVVMPHGEDTYASILDQAGVGHRQMGCFRRLPRPDSIRSLVAWLLCALPAALLVFLLVRREKADVVHVNGILNVQGALAARLAGAKLVWHINDVRDLGSIRWPLRILLRSWADWIIMASAAAWANWFGDGTGEPSNMTVLYPPVDTDEFCPLEDPLPIRRELGIADGEKVVGIVGNMNPAKGHEHFLAAAKVVRDVVSDVRFLVVGQSLDSQQAYWELVQGLIRSLGLDREVVLAGQRTDVARMLNAMDVFVLTSKFEAAPIVLLEAAACAKPIVATRVGGVPELVREGENAILTMPEDPNEIADAVLRLLNEPEEARRMGERGRQLAVERFNAEACADKHEEIYRRAVAGSAKQQPSLRPG